MSTKSIPALELIIDSWGDYRNREDNPTEIIIDLELYIKQTLKKYKTTELTIKVINDPEDKTIC